MTAVFDAKGDFVDEFEPNLAPAPLPQVHRAMAAAATRVGSGANLDTMVPVLYYTATGQLPPRVGLVLNTSA
jgi:hypothetical protein